MEIGGLPLHPLVVHAAVVFVPLSALASIVFVAVPRWRWLSRWPAVVLALVAVLSVWAARITGPMLLDARPGLADLVATHEARGSLLALLVLPYAALVVAAALSLAGVSPLPSGRGAHEVRWPSVARTLPALTALASLAVLVLVVLTGDSGSRAVWG